MISSALQLILQRVLTMVMNIMLSGIEHFVEVGPESWGGLFGNIWSYIAAPMRHFQTKNIVSQNKLNPHKKRLLDIVENSEQFNAAQASLRFTFPEGQGTQFEQFVRRLQSNVYISEVPPFMDDVINAADVQLITRVVLTYIAQHRDEIEHFNPNNAIRFDKRDYGLPFSAQITCSKKGKYRLFVETNTRMKDGTKNEEFSLLGSGTFKRVLKCYRIDLPTPEIWACSKIRSNIQDAVNEARLMNDLNHAHIPKVDIGHSYNSRSKIALYSKVAIGTLKDVIKGNIVATDEEKSALMRQIFSAVAFFNAKGIVHQDLKPINILIYRGKDGSLRAKVNDFGLARTKTNQAGRGGTPGYESPETSAFYLDEYSDLHETFHKQSTSLAKDIICSMPIVPRVEPAPTIKDDSWSMGIILFKMLYGKKPSFATMTSQAGCGNQIVGRLLEPNPNHRISCAEALKELRAQSADEHANQPAQDEPQNPKKRKLEF